MSEMAKCPAQARLVVGLTPCVSGLKYCALRVCGSWCTTSVAAQFWVVVLGLNGGHCDIMIITGLRKSLTPATQARVDLSMDCFYGHAVSLRFFRLVIPSSCQIVLIVFPRQQTGNTSL